MSTRKTRLIQKSIGDPSEAIGVFNTETSGETIPIVLVPAPRMCCSCCFTVPTGAQTIVEKCGRDYNENLADSGLYVGCYYKQVAYMVTPAAITYNAPVKKCPTLDNVMVDCDLSLVIHIGGSRPQAVKNFIYKLGARRFNEYLSAACDEGIRQLVRDTKLDDVYELRGSGGQEGPEKLLKSLSETFEPYGIIFKRAAITDVHIGSKLVQILQGTTEFSAKLKEAEKEHEHKMKIIRHDNDRELKTVDRDYDRRIQDSQNDQQVALVDREKQRVDAQSRRQVSIAGAQENAQILTKRAQADFDVVTQQAKQQNQELLGRVKSECEAERIRVEQEAKVRVTDAEAVLQASKAKADALIATSVAEGNATKRLKMVREHNLRMAQFEVSENIARNSKLVIGGDSGEKLINTMVNFQAEV